MLIEGRATVEAAGTGSANRAPDRSPAWWDAGGRPLPLSGLTVQLAARSRVLVIDARRLAGLIDSGPVAATIWRKMSQRA